MEKGITHAEEIMRAVAVLVKEGKEVFSRKEIRDKIGLRPIHWHSGYTAIFQGMRVDQPGGAPQINSKLRNVFKSVSRGKFILTKYGKEILVDNEQY